MSNRKKSAWERHAQYERNQENHVRTEKNLLTGEMTRFGTKKYFTAQRKMFRNIVTFNRNRTNIRGDK